MINDLNNITEGDFPENPPPCPKERGEQERLLQGGPSFGPLVGALDSR
jgi:hypothetical protein